jgi:L-threonylcarbamoyladenylate synthase
MAQVRTLPADGEGIEAAVGVLRAGGLVALPTETVYGLGADADSPDAVARVFEAKGRPEDHPLIVHVAGPQDLDRWAQDVPPVARDLAEAFWPGPLTLVLRRRPGAAEAAAGGAPTIALRCPSHPAARAVLDAFGGGIAAPSANRFGRVSPTTAAHVLAELGEVLTAADLVLDGGPCAVGVESTIVDVSEGRPRIVRPGGVTAEQLESVAGAGVVPEALPGSVRAPGTLDAHYAPAARVLLAEPSEFDAVVDAAPVGEIGVIATADVDVASPRPVHRLAGPADAQEYAQELYAALRRADELGLVAVVAVLPPAEGIGSAVRDRLRRAATGSGG